MKKLGVAAGAAVVLVLVLLVGRRSCGHHDQATSGDKAAHGAHVGMGAASQKLDAVAPWLAQLGVKPRKIAGKVMFAGQPVAGAIVRLGLDPGLNVIQQLAETKSGADGSFDFGARPATRFNVSAESPGKKPAQRNIDVADPKAK